MTEPPHVSVAAAIIAGGRGSRLGGMHKGLLLVHGRRIIDTQLALLRTLFSRVLVVANDAGAYAGLDVPVVADARGAGFGPIAGIETALASLLPHENSVVCVAADMPFLSQSVLRVLRDHAPSASALVPLVAGRYQPLCARYGRACLPRLRHQIDRQNYKLMDLVEALSARSLLPEHLPPEDRAGRFAANINTPDDFAKLGT